MALPGQKLAGTQDHAPHRGTPAVKLARLIRDLTHDGVLLAETLVEIVTDGETTKRDRIEAAKVLLERGFGKPLETHLQVHASVDDAGAVTALADTELARLADLLSAGRATAPQAPLPAPSLEAMGRADILEAEYRAIPPRTVTLPDDSVTQSPRGAGRPTVDVDDPPAPADGDQCADN